MEQGAVDESIREQAHKQGLPLPDRIKNAPELMVGLGFYYTAFIELSSERHIGMAEGRIPLTAIREYAKECGLYEDWEEYERLKYLVWAMDAAYLDWREKKTKKMSKRAGKK